MPDRSHADIDHVSAGYNGLMSLLDGLPDGILTARLDGTVQSANRAAEAMLGAPAADLVGRPFEDLLCAASRDHVRAAWKARVESGAGPKPAPIRARVTYGIGGERPVDLVFGRVSEPGGAVMVVTLRDAAEVDRLERQVAHAQRMEAVGQLAGGLAHDVNNSLTVMITYGQLLEGALPIDSPLRAHVKAQRDAAVHSAMIVRRLLEFSRRESLRTERVRLAAALERTIEMIAPLLGDAIELALVDDLAPGTEILADATAIEQIVVNLAINARDAMPHGGRLTFGLTAIDADDAFVAAHPAAVHRAYVAVRVEDTGVGMDAATAERVFEPFFTTKPAGVGSGLGLSMVAGLMRQHGGLAEVRSAPAAGTTVTLYFPRD